MTPDARIHAASATLVAFAAGYALRSGDVGLALVCAASVGVLLRWLGREVRRSRVRTSKIFFKSGLSEGGGVFIGDGGGWHVIDGRDDG